MATTYLRESSAEAPKKSGDRWRVIVAKPGKGSSGTYSEDLFRRDGHKIIPNGGQAFIGHDPERNLKDLVGIYPEGSRWSEEDKAVIADLEPFSHWKQFVEEVGPHVGVSLYALGEADEDGNVTAILEDAYNGADLVARPGLVGSGVVGKIYESAKAHDSNTANATAALGNERNKMELEDVVKAVEALTAQVAGLVADKKTTEAAEAKVEADATAVAEALASFKAAVALVDQAELLEPQRVAILEAAEKGEDVAPLIEQAKAIKDAALESVRLDESQGRVLGDGTASKFGAWS